MSKKIISDKKIKKNRTKGTAIEILRLIKTISLSDLLAHIYMHSEDSFATEMIKQYETQLVLAHEKPDTFVRNLHSFYLTMASLIKKRDGYKAFFSFCYFVFTSLSAKQYNDEKITPAYHTALNCYYDIILQQMNYLVSHPKMVYGLRSNHTLLVKDEPYPYLDIAIMELFESSDAKTQTNAMKNMRRHGLHIYTEHDFLRHQANDQLITNMTLVMAPLLNENTEQINPHHYYPLSEGIRLLAPVVNTSLYKKWLLEKQYFLPTNGLRAKYNDSADIKEIYYQEIWVDNRIVLLYKVTTERGEFSGFYDTELAFFFSPWEDSRNGVEFHLFIENFVLETYCLLTIDSDRLFTDSEWQFRIHQTNTRPVLALANVPMVVFYLPSKGTAEKGATLQFRIFDRSSLQPIMTSVSPYIRRLPQGAKASKEAIDRAKRYHYVLRDGETFVRPFEKRNYHRSKET